MKNKFSIGDVVVLNPLKCGHFNWYIPDKLIILKVHLDGDNEPNYAVNRKIVATNLIAERYLMLPHIFPYPDFEGFYDEQIQGKR
jgi:hypothetical protein